MNINNLKKLKAWLDDGAPHRVFSMDYGVLPISKINNQEEFLDLPEIERNKPGIGDCGTVCCIAGASYLMSQHLIDSKEGQEEEWSVIEPAALSWLGLKLNDNDFGHKLFNPYLAPKNCTPQQAAMAVQNVIDGADAWTGIKGETSDAEPT